MWHFSSHHLWIGTDFLYPSQWTEINEPFCQGRIKTKGANSNAFREQAGKGNDWSKSAGEEHGGNHDTGQTSHHLLEGIMLLHSSWSSRGGNAGLGLPDTMPFQEKPEIQVMKCHGFYASATASRIRNPSVWVNQNRSTDWTQMHRYYVAPQDEKTYSAARDQEQNSLAHKGVKPFLWLF